MAEVAEPIVVENEAPPQNEDEDVDVDEEEEDMAVAAVEEEDELIAVGGATEIKLFGKWAFDDIEVRDISLVVRLVYIFCI